MSAQMTSAERPAAAPEASHSSADIRPAVPP
jgi:hypothetical protein